MADRLTREALIEYLPSVPKNSKIYLGCDSEKIKIGEEWWADYSLVMVIHKGQNNGCKIFGDIVREKDYDKKADRPAMRLMNEVYKVVALYQEYLDILDVMDCEIHIDINPNEKYGSSCVVSQAIGYIKGVCGIEPKVKPDALIASYAADRLKSLC